MTDQLPAAAFPAIDDASGCVQQTAPPGRDGAWVRAARLARALSWFSLAWRTAEGVLGLVAGLAASSIALIGWALSSAVEGLASVIVIWRFTGSRTLSETAERQAQKAVAVSFWLLAPYIAAESLRDLLNGHRPDSSTLGIALTAASVVVMPLLGRAKHRLGARLGSVVTRGREPRTCCAWRLRLPCWRGWPPTLRSAGGG